MAPRALFACGAVIRTGPGPSALLMVTEARPGHGGSAARYWGIHCMGGYAGAYHERCEAASAADMEVWHAEAGNRARTPWPDGSVIGIVEDG